MIEDSKESDASSSKSAARPAPATPTPATPAPAAPAAVGDELAAVRAAAAAADSWQDAAAPLEQEPLASECTIEDFGRVDLRVARIVAAEHVPEANKLLKLQLSLGGGVYRQVFAGIKAAYAPDQLVGRLVICVANLKPRKMKFGLSEGMVTAAGGGGTEVFLLSPDTGALPGQRVH